MAKLQDLTEHPPFGKLTAIRFVRIHGGQTLWLCKCECGSERLYRAGHLRAGRAIACPRCSLASVATCDQCGSPLRTSDGTCPRSHMHAAEMTPAEIEKRAAAIRAGWNAETELKRRGGHLPPVECDVVGVYQGVFV